MLQFVHNGSLDPASAAKREPRFAISYDAVAPLFALTDVIIISVAGILGGISYQLFISGLLGDVEAYLGIGLFASFCYVVCAHHLGLYRLESLLENKIDYGRVISCIAFVILVLAVMLFLLKLGSAYSRGSVICFIVLTAVLLFSWRIVLKLKLRTAITGGFIRGRRALIVGDSTELAEVTKSLLLVKFGIAEIGRFALPRIMSDTVVTTRDTAAIESAIVAARTLAADEVLLCISWGDRTQLQLLRDQFRALPLPVRLLPDSFVRSIAEDVRSTSSVGLVDIQRAPLTRAEQIIKRSFDLAVATLALVMCCPLLAVTAIALKLDGGGPIIFRQRRRGFNGREFEIYKFRTMTVLEDGACIPQAQRHDARVTAIGRILRRTSIDELPQLYNVIKDEMSIVGPRPHAVAHDDEFATRIGNYAFRHHMKPGITGWAQVHGLRGGTPLVEQIQNRIDQDIWYIDNWSMMLDLQIVARTCLELMRPRNAY